VNMRERRLTGWPRQVTPEPRRMRPTGDIAAHARGHARLAGASGRARRWAPVLAAATVVLIAAMAVVVAAVRASHPASPARRPAATLLKPSHGPASGLPAGVASLRLVGASGATAWELTTTGLSVSDDAGQHWSAVPLPAGVATSSVITITASVGRGVWLAVWRSPAIDLYWRDAGSASWSRRRLVPLPSAFNLTGQLPGVSITLAPSDVVTVVASWGITSTAAYSTLFISSDDGAAFVQHRTNIGLTLVSDTFLSPLQGIVVAGPVANFLYRTADGGASWSLVTIPGLPAGPGIGYVSYGTPGPDRAQILLPVIVTSSDGAQSISVYRSTNGGAAFTGPTGPPLQIPVSLSAGQVSPAITGSVIWLPARGRIYQSTDSGATWTAVNTTQSPDPINLINGSQAIGIATDSGCRGGKSDCYYYTYLIGTTDDGRTWRTL
jgi:hypothetical protein